MYIRCALRVLTSEVAQNVLLAFFLCSALCLHPPLLAPMFIWDLKRLHSLLQTPFGQVQISVQAFFVCFEAIVQPVCGPLIIPLKWEMYSTSCLILGWFEHVVVVLAKQLRLVFPGGLGHVLKLVLVCRLLVYVQLWSVNMLYEQATNNLARGKLTTDDKLPRKHLAFQFCLQFSVEIQQQYWTVLLTIRQVFLVTQLT